MPADLSFFGPAPSARVPIGFAHCEKYRGLFFFNSEIGQECYQTAFGAFSACSPDVLIAPFVRLSGSHGDIPPEVVLK